MNDQHATLDEQIRAALKEQAAQIEVESEQLFQLARLISAPKLEGHPVKASHRLWQRLREFWLGETFVPWSGLAGAAAVLIVLVSLSLSQIHGTPTPDVIPPSAAHDTLTFQGPQPSETLVAMARIPAYGWQEGN